MSGSTRPPSGGAPRQPWSPENAPRGVTCPACGLTNEPGARTCRNCGLPVASDRDPLRGVAPGSVELPTARRSGLSAALGFVLVVGLLLVGGTLAVSGGGILSTGGRLVSPAETPAPSAATTTAQSRAEGTSPSLDVDGAPDSEATTVSDRPEPDGTSFDYTCDDGAIEDLSSGKWLLSEVAAGVRSGDDGDYDRIYWTLSRKSKKDAKKAPSVTMEWTTPQEAQRRFGIGRVQGNRALLITFYGTIDITANQTIEAALLEAEGIGQVKKIQLFEDEDGRVRTAIGIRGDSCARMEAKGWGGKAKGKNGRILLDIERVAS